MRHVETIFDLDDDETVALARGDWRQDNTAAE
jgi:hypothetical protein